MLLTSLFAFGSSATVHSYTYDRNLRKDYVLTDDISSTMRYDVDSWYTNGARVSTQVTAYTAETGYALAYILGDNGVEVEQSVSYINGQCGADTGIIVANGSVYAVRTIHKTRRTQEGVHDTCWHYIYEHEDSN